MAAHLHNADCERLLNSLISELGYPLELGGQPALAFRGTDVEPGPVVLSLEDAAPAVELLVQPVLWAGHAGAADRALDFLLAMGSGAMLHGHWSASAIDILKDDPRDFRIMSGAYEFSGDLSRGELRQQPRQGQRPGLLHTGNMLEFRWGGRHCLDVEDAIVDCGITREDGLIRLFHESRLSAMRGLFTKRAQEVGRLRYTYTIAAGNPTLRVEVVFTPAPGVALRDLRITTAVDDASADLPFPVDLVLVEGGKGLERQPAPAETRLVTLHEGPARLVVLAHEGASNQAIALASRPAQPDQVLSVKATSKQPRRLHWVVTRHSPQPGPDGRYRVVEDRLMLTAGLPKSFADGDMPLGGVASAEAGHFDAGAASAAGQALHTVAAHLLLAQHGGYAAPPSPARQAQLRQWCDRHLEAWFERPRHRLRDTAFVLLALDSLRRTDGMPHDRNRMEEALPLLLARQLPGEDQGAFADSGQAATLDGHAAAMLALARLCLAPLPEPLAGQVRAALRAALVAVRPGSVDVVRDQRRIPVDSPVVRCRLPDGSVAEDGAVQTGKAALLQRALRMMEIAAERGRLQLDTVEKERMASLSAMSVALIRRRMRLSGQGIEISALPASTLVTTDSQAGATLALLEPATVSLAPYPESVN